VCRPMKDGQVEICVILSARFTLLLKCVVYKISEHLIIMITCQVVVKMAWQYFSLFIFLLLFILINALFFTRCLCVAFTWRHRSLENLIIFKHFVIYLIISCTT